MSVAQSHCLAHPLREAAARCLGCSQTFCRECVTETSGAMYCQRCLQAQAVAAGGGGTRWRLAGHGALAGAGLTLLFGFFYLFLEWMATQPARYLLQGLHGH